MIMRAFCGQIAGKRRSKRLQKIPKIQKAPSRILGRGFAVFGVIFLTS